MPGTPGPDPELPLPEEPARQRPLRAAPDLPSAVVDRCVWVWNDMASCKGLPQVAKLTAGRRDKLRSRIRAFWPSNPEQGFTAYCQAIASDPFNLGNGPRGWKCDFDYAVRSDDVVTKILEKARAREDDQ